MNKLLTLLIVIFMIFGCGENFTDKNTTNSTEQGGSNTGDNTGSGSDNGNTGDNTGNGSDSGDTGDNTGDGSDSGNTGDNTGDGSDSGNTGDNTGNGSDSGDNDGNTPPQVENVTSILIKSCVNSFDEENNPIKSCEQEITELTLDLTNKISAEIQGDAKPQNAANRLVYYTVEPSSLASIDSNGNVTAKNTGEGTITVKSDSNPEVKQSIPLTITNSAAEKGETIPVQAIGFEETSLILQMGETYKLTPKFTPVNTTERDFECSVGNLANFVDVNKDTCEITGKKLTTYNGLVEIKSKNKALSGIISPVTVVDKKIPLENFSITPKSITVDKGEQAFLLTDKFQITYNPADTNEKDFNYSSNNRDILFNVSSSRFRPDNIGVATITVTSKFHPEMFEEVIVNVKDPYDKEPPVHDDINPSDMATYSDRMYIKIMFDVISSTGDIKNNEGLKGIHQIDVQPSDKKGIELITKNMNGYISNYGFCEKYGCMQERPENEDIAVKSSGINYYVGHNDLYIPVRNSGKSTYNIYTIFSFGSARLYYRSNEQLVIDWDQYNPDIHKNIAKFHIILKDRTFSSTFDGFDTK